MYMQKRTHIRIWICERWVSPTWFVFLSYPGHDMGLFRYFLCCVAAKRKTRTPRRGHRVLQNWLNHGIQ
jgi:hypothetical protein